MRALKNACASRWNRAAIHAPTPIASIMYPSWLIVEYASTFLMSVCTIATSAASVSVMQPMIATNCCASGVSSTKIRAVRYTPAATIVAAWIKALTGVGPSIASGSHTCSGNWALLPIAPQNSSIPIQVARLRPQNVRLKSGPPAVNSW